VLLVPRVAFIESYRKTYYMSKKFTHHSQQSNFFDLLEKILRVAQKNLVVRLTMAIYLTIENHFVTPLEILVNAEMFSSYA
jgi:hypothetical protein